MPKPGITRIIKCGSCGAHLACVCDEKIRYFIKDHKRVCPATTTREAREDAELARAYLSGNCIPPSSGAARAFARQRAEWKRG